MATVVLAILPVFALIFLGTGLRRWRLLSDAFWEPAVRLTYFVLFPALLATTLASADLEGLDVGRMAAALVTAVVVMTIALLAARRALGFDGPVFTSVFQGSVRLNTYVGLSVALSVYGVDGLAAAAVAVAVVVPLVNLLSVAALARFAANGAPSWRQVPGQIARNPLIAACALGIVLNLTGLGLPPVIGPLLEILGRAALPLGLLAVGANLDFAAALAGGRAVATAVGLKLVVLPLITVAACWVWQVEAMAAFVAVLFNGTPAAPSSYILARQLGGDARLMAGIITVQTALAVVTLPLLLTVLTGGPP